MIDRLQAVYRGWIVPVMSAAFLPGWTLVIGTVGHGQPPFQTVADRIAFFAAFAGGAAAIVLGIWALVDRAQAHEAMSRWSRGMPQETRLQTACSAMSGAAFFLAMPQVLYEFDVYSELLRDHADLIVTPWTTLFALCLIQLVFGLAQNFSAPRQR